MSDFVSKQHVIDALTGVIGHLRHLTEPDRKFLEIIAEYPKFCTYPEYKGKPYYSIKYEASGETVVGFGTYKPEVLSQYLREYFILPIERKAEVIEHEVIITDTDNNEYYRTEYLCGVCKKKVIDSDDYCSHCGAKLEWNE